MTRRSRRKKRNRQVGRAERAAVLEKRLNLSGAGEDPVIQTLLGAMQGKIKLSPIDRIDLGMKLMELEGAESLADVDPDYVNKMKQEAMDYAEAEAKYNEDPTAFIEDVTHRAESEAPSKEKQAESRARSSKLFSQFYQEAIADNATRQLRVRQLIGDGPGERETIYVPGIIEMHQIGEGSRPVNIGDWVTVDGVNVHFPPGQHEVHPVIAQAWRNKQHSNAESDARKGVMQGNHRKKVFERKMREVDAKFGSQMVPHGQ